MFLWGYLTGKNNKRVRKYEVTLTGSIYSYRYYCWDPNHQLKLKFTCGSAFIALGLAIDRFNARKFNSLQSGKVYIPSANQTIKIKLVDKNTWDLEPY